MNIPSWLAQATGAIPFATNPNNGFQPTMGDALQGIGHSLAENYRRSAGAAPAPSGVQLPGQPGGSPLPAPIATPMAPMAPPVDQVNFAPTAPQFPQGVTLAQLLGQG